MNNRRSIIGKSIDLTKSLRNYFSDICDIHIKFRKEIEIYKIDSETNIKNIQTRWLSSFPDYRKDLLAVVFGALKEGNMDKTVDTISISTQIDDYRKVLERRTLSLDNMSSRQVAW